MSIRLIAQDLYRLEKEVEKLKEQYRSAPFQDREAIKERLRRVKGERNRMRRALDGAKESPPCRQPR
ncbi:MAG: hypothetical protein SWE60_20580 [Thermodesulfobacteriota bacterium]|nr:hypothetical protein [Thermodesulfobacteriota bacterium]